MLKRLDPGRAEDEFPDSPKMLYRQLYYQALDLITLSINDRFNQPGYKIYQQLEDLLLKAIHKEDFESSLSVVSSFYSSDINQDQLRLHLTVLASNFSSRSFPTAMDNIDCVRKMTVKERELIGEVCNVLQLLLVMPSTNAISERSFSALRRVKTYLRNSMSQERLNHLLVLHVHKNLTDSMDLIAVANEFVSLSSHRQSIFGTFTQADILPVGHCGRCKASLKCTSCK